MLTQEHIIRLQDIAVCACHTGAVHEARKVFDGLLTLQADSASALIGKAMSHLVVNEFEEAEAILQTQVLAKKPDDAEALAMLGLSFVLSGRHDEARAVLGTFKAQENASAQLARELLVGLG